MEWTKHIIVDLLALIVIAAAVLSDQIILTYVVYVYTALMVLARFFSLVSGNFRAITEKKVSEAPLWAYHIIYALTTLVLIYGSWYITAAGWIFIWVAAVIAFRKKV